MPDVPWTPDLVRARLIDAFRVLPGASVRPTAGARSIAAPDTVTAALNWPRRFLVDDAPGWTALLAWARCKASGETVEDTRRAMGWGPNRFHKAHRRAAAAIAAGLNRESENFAAVAASAAAGNRLAARLTLPCPRPDKMSLDEEQSATAL